MLRWIDNAEGMDKEEKIVIGIILGITALVFLLLAK